MQSELSPTEAIILAKEVAILLPSPPRIYENCGECVEKWPSIPGEEKILYLQYITGTPIPLEMMPTIKLVSIVVEGKIASEEDSSLTLVQKLKRLFNIKSDTAKAYLAVGSKNVIFTSKWGSNHSNIDKFKHSWYFHIAVGNQVSFIGETGDRLISYYEGPYPC
jgi:hypothetical protein